MSLESDKQEIIQFLGFLKKKESEFLTYRTMFAALNHEYPEEDLKNKFLHVEKTILATDAQKKYADLVEQVRSAQDSQALVTVILRWIESRSKPPSTN